ncbi:MAG: glycosyltransferase family 4 protein [Promethearchaeota archaeon]
MNILYIVHGFPPSIGAGAINAYKIAKYLAELNNNILVLSPGVFSKISPESKISVIEKLKNTEIKVNYSSKLMRIPLNLTISHLENMARFFLKLKSKFNPDIVLSQYQAYHYASVVGGYISRILKIPHISRSHDIFFPTDAFSLPLRLFYSSLYTRIYRSILKCDIFYVTTSEMRRYYLKFDKLKNINFKIHHNGIDTSEFFPSHKEELKSFYGANDIILFVGQISRDYDLGFVLKVIPEILKTHKDTHFLIIGGGPHEENLLNFIKKTKLSKQIHYLGIKAHKEIPFYVNNSDIGIGRITHENIWRYMIPVKCLEYMACAKPFITAPLSQDLIKNNDVGLVLERNFSEKDLLDKIIMLIEDKSLRIGLGENGLKKIEKKFKWEELMIDFNKKLHKSKEIYLKQI